jgi:hypothetical protein
VTIGYRHDSAQIGQSLRYFAHAGPEIHAKPQLVQNGDTVHLWGTVPKPSARGRVVVLQASAPGSHRWLTFRKATSGKGGKFKSSYRFAHTTIATTYRIRALVPAQANYPWQAGASRPARVRVTP